MFELKALSRDAIPRALDKADHYRLLNEPGAAESICLDVLCIDGDNQRALVTLLLALSDQFEQRFVAPEATALLSRLHDEYERRYYAGIICERRAKALIKRNGPGAESRAYSALREAMRWYEQAEEVRQPENDDATLRWNTCARVLMSNPHLRPALEERFEAPLE